MSLGASRGRLGAVSKKLKTDWEETRKRWLDAKATEFEERYMANLLESVERTIPMLEELDKILSRIKKDCE